MDTTGKKLLAKLNSCFCREFYFPQIGFFLEKCLPENLSESKHWILIGTNPAGTEMDLRSRLGFIPVSPGKGERVTTPVVFVDNLAIKKKDGFLTEEHSAKV